MLSSFFRSIVVLILVSTAWGAAKPHLITFGKWTTVKWLADDRGSPTELKVRAMYVDGRLKEYTTGATHDITDRMFVVQRVFRLNDSLPGDKTPAPQWLWQRSGYLLVERNSGRVTALALPEFDPYLSVASWYRDYAAYCGVSQGGDKLYQMVVQVGRRRPVLRKALPGFFTGEGRDSACPAPEWQRLPSRVTFALDPDDKVTFEVHGHSVDLIAEDDDQDSGTN
jgi:hypothetical protein